MHENISVEGKVVLMKKTNVLDFNNVSASIVNDLYELLGKKLSFRLVSAVCSDPGNTNKGKVGKESYLEEWVKTPIGLGIEECSEFKVKFEWNEEEMSLPGAFIVRNEHHSEFYLKTLTLQHIPNHGRIHFVCNSWVYPAHRYRQDRVFFSNKTYLPYETPSPLRNYREEELASLRGNGEGMLNEWDRVYDYAFYNDLGNPDKGPESARPIYGGSIEYPYPRRVRTGRPSTKTDPRAESRLPLAHSLETYVPRDEQFRHLKMSDFLGDNIRSIVQTTASFAKEVVLDKTPKEFDSFEDVLKLYQGEGIRVAQRKTPLLEQIKESIPSELFKSLIGADGSSLLKFPLPDIIKEDKSGWRTDEEFAREMVAGVHPIAIRRLNEFPPVSKLDAQVYGNQTSKITKECIEQNLDGFTVHEAITKNRMFILDHHDSVMPLLRQINTETSSKLHATRTLLFLKEDGTLRSLAIELSLPDPRADTFGCISDVYTPAHEGVQGSIWQLAKAYVAVTDSGYHQLINHWLHTHAVIEPFGIATHRQLSVVHPIYKLLHPHFRDTMKINAIARQVALNANGLFEFAVFPGKYAVQWTSNLYKDWVLTDHAVPRDLVKRGMAVDDPESIHGYKLIMEDYPYAVDALEIWSAISTWVKDYCSFYYKSNEMITRDTELESWWNEIREIGHGDKKDEKWWPEMNTLDSLTQTLTTIIWVASALHAAVNFGQYPYGGYFPNRPTGSRKLMPEPGSRDFEELTTDPERAFLRTVVSQAQALVGISLIEVLSRHSIDEVYLGQRDTPEWTSDLVPLEASEKFQKKLKEVEENIVTRNGDGRLKNRVGPAKMEYTLLCPSSGTGISGRGIPNSIST